MSEKIEFEVTDAVVEAAANAECLRLYSVGIADCFPDFADAARRGARVQLKAALAHPSFQSQLRAYAAGIRAEVLGEVRAGMPKVAAGRSDADIGFNQCHRLVIATLTTLEQQP